MTQASRNASEAGVGGEFHGIWVSGGGSVSVAADIATLGFGVEATRDTVAEAMAEAAEAMQAIIDSLQASGISADDIETRRFSVTAQYRWVSEARENVFLGFEVDNTVSATIRDLDSIPAVIDNAVAAGGDDSRVGALSFSVEDTSEAEREARELAMEAALDQATVLASLAGVELGAPFYISESGARPSRSYDDMDYAPMAYSSAPAEGSARPSTPILAADKDITMRVYVGYSIKQ